jgi:hypothetical protein
VAAQEEMGTMTESRCSVLGCTQSTEERCSHCERSHCDQHLYRETGRHGVPYAFCPDCVKKAKAMAAAARQTRIQFTLAGVALLVGAAAVYLIGANSMAAAVLLFVGLGVVLVGLIVT